MKSVVFGFDGFDEFRNSDIFKLEFGSEASKYKSANFDSRAFNLSKDEVVNYFIWRQQDATRNSIQMVGRSYFSDKELYKKSCNQIQDKLYLEKNVNFNDIETYKKRGTIVYYKDSNYIIDKDIPIFTQDRNYIQNFVDVEER
jgi:tRNA(His) 5'-end guanylyltransferase